MAFTDVEWKFKKVGKNVQIGKNVYFRYPEETIIGDNVTIDEFCYFSTSLEIGSNVHIAPFCSVIGGRKSKLIMEDFAGLSAGVRVICSSDDFISNITGPTIPIDFRPDCKIGSVRIKRHGLLGTNSVVHPNVIIEEGAATGSMTLVNASLEPWFVYIGIPARKHIERNKKAILEQERKYNDWRNETIKSSY